MSFHVKSCRGSAIGYNGGMDATAIRHILLENGAVMGRGEFHRLFEDCEELERVELIEGVVYMPSPVKFEQHSQKSTLMILWLGAYQVLHPGEVAAADGASLLLDGQNEPIPDAMLFRLRPGRFQDGYVVGAPELVVEVANSSLSRDLHPKKEAYRRNGVLEYLVWRVRDEAIDWYQLRNGAYELRTPDAAGIIESEVFPGLPLDVAAALDNNLNQVLAAVRES
jgi:Uma2 family endonuclease